MIKNKQKLTMKKIFVILTFLITILLISCQVNETPIPSENLVYISDTVKYNEVVLGSNIGDNFSLNSTSREGQYLSVNVSYSGGCKNHDFNILWNEAISKSNPPSTTILITHDANDDNCESYLTEIVIIDLKELFGSEYSDSLNVMIVNGYLKK